MSGVLCDRRMKAKIKGKVYKTIVRLAIVYRVETLAVKKVHEKKMEVAEMKMLRWLCGALGWTRLETRRSEEARKRERFQRRSKNAGCDGTGRREEMRSR